MSRTLGYLAYLDAASALNERDAPRLTRANSMMQKAVSDDRDVLDVLGRVVGGIAALLESRVADGYRMLDEALLPVLDERVSPEWAGDVYRTGASRRRASRRSASRGTDGVDAALGRGHRRRDRRIRLSRTRRPW